jgi:integrase
MSRKVGRLSSAAVRNAKPARHRRVELIADGGNLYLQVSRGAGGTVNRSWIFRYEHDGRQRDIGLGPTHTRGLGEAREKARELRAQLLDGIDPLEARRTRLMAERAEAAKAMSFADCAKAYVAAHRDKWSNAEHVRQWQATLESTFPVLGQLPVATIDTGLVLKVLESIWKTTPETASRLRGRIERVLDFAKVRGYRDGENPARWRGHLDHLLPARSRVQGVKHLAALPYAELPALMAELHQRTDDAALALQFVILAACRTGELLKAHADEFDLNGRVWTIPAAHTKAGREHRVPLVDRALAIIETRPHKGPLFALAQHEMQFALRAIRPGTTVHGTARSAFSTWAAETTAFPSETIEAALAHAERDKVAAAYQRGDRFAKRRKLMEAWERYCTATPAAGGEVLPIRGRR